MLIESSKSQYGVDVALPFRFCGSDLYALEPLEVRTKPRKKLATRARVPLPLPTRPNERWSMDFQRPDRGRSVVSHVDGARSLHARVVGPDRRSVVDDVKVAETLSRVLRHRSAPAAITVDNGSEFASRAMEAWAYAHAVRLDFIRPGKPVDKAYASHCTS